MNYIKYILTFIVFSALVQLNAQANKYQAATIGFYNVENLFDIEESADLVNKKYPFYNELNRTSMSVAKAEEIYNAYKQSKDTAEYEMYIDYQILNDEFTPNGKKVFDEEKYKRKLHNLASVISKIGKSVTQNAPVIMGLVEVENKQVIEDLINEPELAKYNYGIVHYNSIDKRGIDVALIYQKNRFEVISSKKFIVDLPIVPGQSKDITRDILSVSGLLDGEPFTFIVNHWPSRRGGEAVSNPKREKAAEVLKSIFEEIQNRNPTEKIIAMGDFNDDAVSPSIKKVLQAEGKENKLSEKSIYSPMEKMYKNGMGTLAYRDGWNLFDMQFMSSNLISKDLSSYKVHKTEIYSPLELVAPSGQYKGYPRRMYGGDTFDEDGYSDHFPVFSILLREVKK